MKRRKRENQNNHLFQKSITGWQMLQGNLEETLTSREQETSRTFSVRSQRGFKVKPRSCKLLQNGKKDTNALNCHTVIAGQMVVWHLPARSTEWSLSEMGLSWSVSGMPAPQEVPSGIVERKIVLRQAGQTSWRGWKRGGVRNNGESICFLGHYTAMTDTILVQLKELGHWLQ